MIALAAALLAVLPPQVSGSFYPSDPAELRAAVDGYVAAASSAAPKGELLAVLAPHAGYEYSGRVAGAAYASLKGRSYETVFLLATGHHVALSGAALPPAQILRTPLGDVPVDEAAAARLSALTGFVAVSTPAYQGEHSVEVQLPFLQRMLKPGFRVVPLLLNTDDPAVQDRLGDALAALTRPGKTLIVISSDLSHYPAKDEARVSDTTMLGALSARSGDADYFRLASRLILQRANKDLVCTFCGEAAVAAALRALGTLGARASVLAYENSGEQPGRDPARAVGYAAVRWTRGVPDGEPPLTADQRRVLLKLARGALTAKLGGGGEPAAVLWRDPAFDRPAAVFVTLRAKDGALRGCIGDLAPEYPLAEAVERFALKSALDDRRFGPVGKEELASLSIEISRLSPFRRVRGADAIKSGSGVVARQGARSGVFLPEVWWQLPKREDFFGELCAQKAGLPRDCWNDPKTAFEVFDSESFSE